MPKIIVIGCPGSGKTTFAIKLNEITNIPIYHLDAIWHKADRTHITRDEFDKRLDTILNEESWIIDGNYSRTLDIRMQYADTIILFDLTKDICLEGAIKRLGEKRYDMPWIDKTLDPELKEEIEMFPVNNLPKIYELLNKYQDKVIIIFKSREEADEYLNNISTMVG